MMHGASTQTVDKIKFSKSILIPSSPTFVGFFVCITDGSISTTDTLVDFWVQSGTSLLEEQVLCLLNKSG